MFKKTLIAVALAAVSTGAMAVDVKTISTSNAAAQTYGSEALNNGTVKNDGDTLKLGADAVVSPASAVKLVGLKLGAEYTQGDTLTLTLAGAKFVKTEVFSLTQSSTVTGNDITFGFLSATDNTITFRVTSVAGITKGITTELNVAGKAPSIILNSTEVGAKATISAAALTSTGLSIDVTGATDSYEVAEVIQEHAFKIATLMDAKIDVAQERKVFATAADAKFIVNYTPKVASQASFVPTDFTYKLNGSFTGFEKSVSTTANDGEIKASALGVLTVAADLQSASVSKTASPASETFTFTTGSAAKLETLNVGSYTLDVELKKGTDTTKYTGIKAGSHTLNGSSAQYGYVPVNFDGAVVSQFEIGNKGVVDGEISITAFDRDGIKHSAVLPFKAVAGKMTKVSDADISTAFGLTKGASLNLTITVNAPNGDITYAGYSNRGTTGRMSLVAVKTS
ncbi:hypothetical protein [Shewanella frigidimarina]|uniref:hypothetical protein n=1 Tax=Shewanella frigidimarina TaxID=56812 RepID=UPI003D796A77